MFKTIRNKLLFVHRHKNIHGNPTAVKGYYILPADMMSEVILSNYSRESLQKVADHIGYFLGLMDSVKVNIIFDTSSKSNMAGFYRASPPFHKEITINKASHYDLWHIMAILAHESTHNYLHSKGIVYDNEQENEILTDVTAAYLGLGKLLFRGYQDNSRLVDVHSNGYTVATNRIGYLKPTEIMYAIKKAAILRCMPEFVSFLSFADKVYVKLVLLYLSLNKK